MRISFEFELFPRRRIMAEIDDLKAGVQALKDEDKLVVDRLTSLETKVQTLQAAIDAEPGVSAAIAQAASDVNAEVASFKAALAADPAQPAPVADPGTPATDVPPAV
jgi:predicted  nucleic acid-binding Zn-ribbon protein